MAHLQVAEIDASDETLLQAWWEVGRAACAVDLADDNWLAWSTARRAWTTPDPVRRMLRLGAWAGDELVGVCSVQLDDVDNTHLSFLQPKVRPDRRGSGVGSALLAAAEDVAAADGRTVFVSEFSTRPGDRESRALAFAQQRGYAVASSEEVKVADVAATEVSWPGLASYAAERAGGYRLVSWREHAPEEHLEEIARLYTRFLGEVPLGDLDVAPQQWSPERIRASEDHWLVIGKHQVLVAAVAPDGSLAGYSNLMVSEGRPDRAGIDSTLVLPEHRGQRLGLALKVRLHQEVRAHHPAVERVSTCNATVNRWMNAVNDALGYVVVEDWLEVQKQLRP